MLRTRKKYGRDTVIGVDALLWEICKDEWNHHTYTQSVVDSAKTELVKRLRRELRDRTLIRGHREPPKNEAEPQPVLPLAAASDAEAVTWETADAFDPAMLAELEATNSNRKKSKPKATKKRASPETEAAARAEAAEAAKEQSLENIGVRQLREGDNDWDLIEEPCFICRHPCFFGGVISNHKAAINAATTYDPMENKDPDAESDEEMDEDSEETESTAPGAGTAKPGEVLTPLISCLSPRCLSFLPGCVRELEMIQFYDDAELAGVAKLYDPDGKIEALPSFHAEYELKKNPRKRVGNSSGQPTIYKTKEMEAKLDAWWKKHTTLGDMSGTFVDAKAKEKLAADVGLTSKKVDYWLWGMRKKVRHEQNITDLKKGGVPIRKPKK